MHEWSKAWRTWRWIGLACCVGLGALWLSGGTAHAHGESHLPGNLPACTARALSCEVPPALWQTAAQDEITTMSAPTLPDRHCVDGMGVSRDCLDIGPFTYLRDASSDAKAVDEVMDLAPQYDVACQEGTAGPFACSQVDLLAFLPLDAIGGGKGNDLWGWTDPDTGREYVLMGRSTGTAFVDISDPARPLYLGDLPSHTGSSAWRDVKVYQNHAYIVADLNRDHGLQIFDLTQLRNATNPPVTFTATAHYAEFGDAHNIAINPETGFAYAVGTDTCRGGLHMIDLRTPGAPTFAGCFADDGYTHDVQCVRYRGPDLAHAHREICFAYNEDTLTIVDVTNKEAPLLLARAEHPDGYYVHQGWLTSDHRYLLQDDELDEQRTGQNSRTYIWDVADLENPVLVGSYTGPLPAADHNLYIRGSHAFQANYASGLRILEMGDLSSLDLSEIAYFDTHPPTDANRFFSAWSVYPYFQSDTVAVSTITEGLFLLRPQLPPEFALQTGDGLVELCGSDQTISQTTALRLNAFNGYAGAVQLRLDEKPDGLAATFEPEQVTFSGNDEAQVALTLSANGATAGSYPLTVAAVDADSVMREATFTLQVAAAAPAAVTGLSTDGIAHAGATLRWDAGAASAYRVEVAADAAFESIIEQGTTATNVYAVRTPLSPATTYYWRVQGMTACGAGQPSAVQSFTTTRAHFMPLIVR